jgi:transcriptional regulator with XRE-family HTH domain
MAIEDDTGIVALLARNVRERRKRLGLSQEALAHEAGIDRTYVSQVERRLRNVTVTMLVRLASALETTADRLLVADESSCRPIGAGRDRPAGKAGRSR